jgi:chromosome segregation ATPase
VSEMKPEAALREVLVKAIPVNDDDALDALLGGVMLKEEEIAEITNMLRNNVDMFSDDWSLDDDDINKTETFGAFETTQLIADRNALQKELEDLRSQHQFECEYVDQLEQEIISVSTDRDRQVTELTTQLEQLQKKLSDQQAQPLVSDDRDLSDRLAIHVLQLEEEFKHRFAIALETETQKINQQHFQEIKEKTELINQLQGKNKALDTSQQTLITELEAIQSLLKESNKTLEVAENKLLEVKAQRDQFEEELIQHLSNRAQLHQSLRGLENEYVSDLTRVQELEQQIEDLQNQVLHQASKASEYEAAIQHWKEQSVRHQHHALQLSSALDRLLDEKPVKHLVQSIHQSSESASEQEYKSVNSPAPASTSVRSERPNSKVDLPAFLVRHR